MKMSFRTILILALSLSLCVLPACADDQKSKSVEEAEKYADLLTSFKYDEEPESEKEGSSEPTFEERYKIWQEHERWRDKEVDKFETAEEYAKHYHDEYIQLYMEQYYDDDDYDEDTMLEQSFLDAMDHWEKNQPWPEPKK